MRRFGPQVGFWTLWVVVFVVAVSSIGLFALVLLPLGWWLEAEAKKRGYLGLGSMKRCPRCAEDVRSAAVVCRYCGHEFDSGR
jgi:hypothetical protein